MPSRDDARRIILLRRARFVSAALAGIASCTPRPDAAPAASRDDLVIPPLGSRVAEDAGLPLPDPMLDDEDDGGIDPSDAAPPRVVVSVCLSIIQPTVRFTMSSSAPQKEAARLLDDVAQTLADNPQLHLEIEGHTDATEPARVGDERAKAVKKELERRGVDPSRITTQNAGSAKPIAPNKTAADRAKNRRVDFHAH